MPVFTLEPSQSAALADTLLHALREVRDLVSRPPDVGTLERVAGILRGAKAALDEAVKVPDSRSPDTETGISRQGITLAVEESIAMLAHLKVAIGVHLTRGEPLAVQPVRAFVSTSMIIGSLLATPTLNPRLEVGGVEHHAADPFPDA